MMRRKPFLWMHDPDWVTRAIFWFVIIIVSTISLGFFAVGGFALTMGFNGLGIGIFFLILGIVLAWCAWGIAKDDWTLSVGEAREFSS